MGFKATDFMITLTITKTENKIISFSMDSHGWMNIHQKCITSQDPDIILWGTGSVAVLLNDSVKTQQNKADDLSNQNWAFMWGSIEGISCGFGFCLENCCIFFLQFWEK